jgi:hypothetical protein
VASPVEVVREWKRRNQAGDLGCLGEVVDLDGYTEQCLGLTGWTTGYSAARQNYVRNLVQPWADVVTSEQEVVAGPDSDLQAGMMFDGHLVRGTSTVVIRSRTQATHVGEFLGVAATGRRIAWDSITMVWICGDRVVGQWAQPDLWAIYRQLIGPSEPSGRQTGCVAPGRGAGEGRT